MDGSIITLTKQSLPEVTRVLPTHPELSYYVLTHLDQMTLGHLQENKKHFDLNKIFTGVDESVRILNVLRKIHGLYQRFIHVCVGADAPQLLHEHHAVGRVYNPGGVVMLPTGSWFGF